MHSYVHTFIHSSIHTLQTYIHTNMHAYIHTHIHTFIHLRDYLVRTRWPWRSSANGATTRSVSSTAESGQPIARSVTAATSAAREPAARRTAATLAPARPTLCVRRWTASAAFAPARCVPIGTSRIYVCIHVYIAARRNAPVSLGMVEGHRQAHADAALQVRYAGLHQDVCSAGSFPPALGRARLRRRVSRLPQPVRRPRLQARVRAESAAAACVRVRRRCAARRRQCMYTSRGGEHRADCDAGDLCDVQGKKGRRGAAAGVHGAVWCAWVPAQLR